MRTKFHKEKLLLVFLLIFAYSVVASEDHCVVDHLSAPHRRPTTTILKECFSPSCQHYRELDFGGVIRMLFHGETGGTKLTKSDQLGAAENFKDFSLQNCPIASGYAGCLVDTIRESNLTMANGTEVDLTFFREDVLLAIQILPNLAFCDADEETKQLFYEFLEDGGHDCIIDKQLFLAKISRCLFGSYVMDDPTQRIPTRVFLNRIKRCAPPLVRLCRNGQQLESLFNQTVTASLFRAYNSTWEAMNKSIGNGGGYVHLNLSLIVTVLMSFIIIAQ